MKNPSLILVFQVMVTLANAQTTNSFPASGDVGIGTLTPSVWYGGNNRVLEIAYSRPTLRLTSTVSYDLATIMFTNTSVNTSTRNGEFHLNYQYDASNASNSALRFGTYPAGEMFTLKSNGNVGIGTPNPQAKHHVTGGSTTTSISNVYQTSTLRLDLANPAISLNAGYLSGDYPMIQASNNVTNGFTKLAINPFGGSVLIGKPSHINSSYALDVEGSVRTNEVVVNTTGADFVFENNYDLPPLDQVESYIKQHKHLSDIPSAAEMQENGMQVGEIQTKLLQKIEELTLYLIAQDKKIKELTLQVDLQSKDYFEKGAATSKALDTRETGSEGLNLKEMNLLLLKKVEELTLDMMEMENRLKKVETK